MTLCGIGWKQKKNFKMLMNYDRQPYLCSGFYCYFLGVMFMDQFELVRDDFTNFIMIE